MQIPIYSIILFIYLFNIFKNEIHDKYRSNINRTLQLLTKSYDQHYRRDKNKYNSCSTRVLSIKLSEERSSELRRTVYDIHIVSLKIILPRDSIDWTKPSKKFLHLHTHTHTHTHTPVTCQLGHDMIQSR